MWWAVWYVMSQEMWWARWCDELCDVMCWAMWCAELCDVMWWLIRCYVMRCVICDEPCDVMTYVMWWAMWCDELCDVMSCVMSYVRCWAMWCDELCDVMCWAMWCDELSNVTSCLMWWAMWCDLSKWLVEKVRPTVCQIWSTSRFSLLGELYLASLAVLFILQLSYKYDSHCKTSSFPGKTIIATRRVILLRHVLGSAKGQVAAAQITGCRLPCTK